MFSSIVHDRIMDGWVYFLKKKNSRKTISDIHCEMRYTQCMEKQNSIFTNGSPMDDRAGVDV